MFVVDGPIVALESERLLVNGGDEVVLVPTRSWLEDAVVVVVFVRDGGAGAGGVGIGGWRGVKALEVHMAPTEFRNSQQSNHSKMLVVVVLSLCAVVQQ